MPNFGTNYMLLNKLREEDRSRDWNKKHESNSVVRLIVKKRYSCPCPCHECIQGE
jgi:hypothetical protein